MNIYDRAWRWFDRPGVWLESAGCDGLSALWSRLWLPVGRWLVSQSWRTNSG